MYSMYMSLWAPKRKRKRKEKKDMLLEGVEPSTSASRHAESEKTELPHKSHAITTRPKEPHLTQWRILYGLCFHCFTYFPLVWCVGLRGGFEYFC
ncbi:hypothetical protein BDV38DRAFT_240895 [Aspergillus pseudotamarii]|uniref:Uncharacterized protein n=1 Tax=Aspergillus pseudotamarii TaxID=132259 RepID=A0A5N6SZG4_ASPPS|nr:uncharacterized protein BDV38DRAFT_240895 [Aspergillus pseudotamarii]KAE8140045.1 hypothetical protein BDV38DRAFT_240895 [Aspergillus pseudotamarii]